MKGLLRLAVLLALGVCFVMAKPRPPPPTEGKTYHIYHGLKVYDCISFIIRERGEVGGGGANKFTVRNLLYHML